MRRIGSLLVWVVLGSLAASAGFSAPATAQSGAQGAVCVHDYAAGLTCSSSEVGIAELAAVDIPESCSAGDPASALVLLDVTIACGSLSRFDIGVFIATDGGSALSGGNCYHDYLDPPLTTTPSYPIVNGPWANLEPFDTNDSCGDIEANTEVTKTLRTPLLPLRIACTDTNQDGTVDVSVCTGWRAGSTGGQATCNVLSEAIPASSERCGCQRVEVLREPGVALSLIGGLALLLLAGRIREA